MSESQGLDTMYIIDIYRLWGGGTDNNNKKERQEEEKKRIKKKTLIFTE